jgi:hypothetical protein
VALSPEGGNVIMVPERAYEEDRELDMVAAAFGEWQHTVHRSELTEATSVAFLK